MNALSVTQGGTCCKPWGREKFIFPSWRKGCSEGKQSVGLRELRRVLLSWADPPGLLCALLNLHCPPGTELPWPWHCFCCPFPPHPGEFVGAEPGKGNKSPRFCPVRKTALNKVRSLSRCETISDAFLSNLESEKSCRVFIVPTNAVGRSSPVFSG